MFQLVEISTGQIVRDNGEIRLFATGAEAAAEAARMTDLFPGFKYQPRPADIDDSAWIQREAHRFESGQYKAPCWQNESWWQEAVKPGGPCALHFAHVAHNDPAKLAYTESRVKGAQDRQTQIKPGAYLQQYLGHVLDAVQVAYWSNEHGTRFVPVTDQGFGLATTPREIDRVYRNGPRSCMNNPDEYPDVLEHDPHPAHVFAAGDLAIAYLKSGNGRYTARCMVWPDRKLYGRRYGNGDRLRDLLERAGYRNAYDDEDSRLTFEGARILKVETGNDDYIAPYVDPHAARDRCYYLVHDGDGFRLSFDRDNGVGCMNTDGLSDSDPTRECACCGDRVRREYLERVYVSDHTLARWCESCIESEAMTCEATGRLMASSLITTLADGTPWAASHFAEHGFQCEACGEGFQRAAMSDSHNICNVCHASGATGPSPTTLDPNQIDMTEAFEIRIFAVPSGLDAGTVYLDGLNKKTGTRAECESVAARLGKTNLYYRYAVTPVLGVANAA